MGYNGAVPSSDIPVVSPTFRDVTVTGTLTAPFPSPPVGGPDAVAGSLTLISDPEVVPTTAVRADSLIFPAYGTQILAPSDSSLFTTTIVPGVSFEVGSIGGAAIGAVVNWLIINPTP